VIPTKDNLAKRKWQDRKDCCFCHKNETVKHLFLSVDSLVQFGFVGRFGYIGMT
jgi:hypothetical protein